MTHSFAPRPVASSWRYEHYAPAPRDRRDAPIRTPRRSRVSVHRRASDTHRVVMPRGDTRTVVYSGSIVGAADYLLDASVTARDTGREVAAYDTGRLVIRWDNRTVVTLQALAW